MLQLVPLCIVPLEKYEVAKYCTQGFNVLSYIATIQTTDQQEPKITSILYTTYIYTCTA